MTRTATVLVGCWLAGALPATAQSRILIADLTEDQPVIVSAAPSSCSQAEMLAAACAAEDGHSPREVQNALSCAKPKSSLRWEASRDARLDVFVVYRGEKPRIRFTEQSRKTRISTDIATLMKLGGRLIGGLEAGGEPLSCSAQTYVLERERANLAVTIEQPKRAASTGGSNEVVRLEGGGAAAAKAGSTEDSTATASATLVTGPAEHWFLSADLPFRRFNELKLDDKNQIQPTETPTRFFVGLNYSLGDLLSERPAFSQAIVLKGSILASKHPLEAFGGAIAYRGPLVKSFGFNFDTVSPFIGWFWTRSDVTPPGESPDTTHKFTSTFQMGFTFNLTEALSWTKGDK
jgi:hypothetical protein